MTSDDPPEGAHEPGAGHVPEADVRGDPGNMLPPRRGRRFALERGFTTSDIVGLGVAGALILSYPYVKTQVGLAAVLIVLALIAQRAFLQARVTPPAR